MATFERTQVELVPGWLVVGAMQGRTRPFDTFWATPSSAPQPCRDSFAVHAADHDRALLFAVADGISSEPNSECGARLAVETAIEELWILCRGGLPHADSLRAVISCSHRRLVETAEQRGYPLRTLGTTLTVGALDRFDGILVCASIGDGYVLARGSKDWWFPQSMVPEPTGAVFSLTDPAWEKVCHTDRCPIPVETVIAVTDGLQRIVFEVDRSNPSFAVRRPYARAITALQKAVLENTNVSKTRSLSIFLGMRENEPLMQDDRTVVVLQRLGDARLPFPPPTADASTAQPDGNEQSVGLQRLDDTTPLLPLPINPPPAADASTAQPDGNEQSVGLRRQGESVSPTVTILPSPQTILIAFLFVAILIETAILVIFGMGPNNPLQVATRPSLPSPSPSDLNHQQDGGKRDATKPEAPKTDVQSVPNALRAFQGADKHLLHPLPTARTAEGPFDPGSAKGTQDSPPKEGPEPPAPAP